MLKPLNKQIKKPTKTIAGVTPVAVVLPPRKCEHGTCVYCPTLGVPQSYTPRSPAVMRAMALKYNAFEQVCARLVSFKLMNHPVEKIELIIMGGTFLDYPLKFQNEFIKQCYDALNGKKAKTLAEAQKLNECAKHRCVALCIETRPDVCTVRHIKRMHKWGATRVELGVQIIDDKIYKLVKRGHKMRDVVDATCRLKNAGFKVGYHIMPGLPGSNPEKDLRLFKKLFSDENFKPDQLKLYPCQVIPGAELEKWYWQRKYKPYAKEQTKKLLIEMMKVIPRYCRVMRIMREIPPEYITAGITKIDLRKDVEEELRKNPKSIKEIRFREIGFVLRDVALRQRPDRPPQTEINKNLKLKITKYCASGGDEYFLEIVNSQDILFGLLRLRIVKNSFNYSRPPALNLSASQNININDNAKTRDKTLDLVINNHKNKRATLERDKFEVKAYIREIHVYGQALKIGEKSKEASQHKGLGKWLMSEAEKIARKEKAKKVIVISGVGVRDYYRKLGYKLEESYMVKKV